VAQLFPLPLGEGPGEGSSKVARSLDLPHPNPLPEGEGGFIPEPTAVEGEALYPLPRRRSAGA